MNLIVLLFPDNNVMTMWVFTETTLVNSNKSSLYTLHSPQVGMAMMEPHPLEAPPPPDAPAPASPLPPPLLRPALVEAPLPVPFTPRFVTLLEFMPNFPDVRLRDELFLLNPVPDALEPLAAALVLGAAPPPS